MARSLLDYHFLEDGELNRLWYEENDERARDAFQIRWWIGTESKSADVVAGKDLLANYYTLFFRRCLESGIYAEEHITEVFRVAVKALVAEFPADPIEKFEDLWLTFVDRGIAATKPRLATETGGSSPDSRARLEKALGSPGIDGDRVREWLATGSLDRDESEFAKLLATVQAVLRTLDGAAAENHPLVRTAEPEPSKLDPSVAVPHFHAKPLFVYAFQGGTLSKRENEHIDWCQPCRERCLGALLALRRFRELLGGEVPKLPAVSPHFDQLLQAEPIGIPVIDAAKSRSTESKGGGVNTTAIVVLIVIAIAVAVLIAS